jgi:hypothetical protein
MSNVTDENKISYKYPVLKNINDFECDEACSCRFNSERTLRDKMDYEVFVLGKNIKLEPLKIVIYSQKY